MTAVHRHRLLSGAREARGLAVVIDVFRAFSTAAYAFESGALRVAWQVASGGTSPVYADGLLYVYDPSGALRVYDAGSGTVVARLAAGGGHWNSPIVADGRIALPEGDANEHRQSGTVNIYRLP